MYFSKILGNCVVSIAVFLVASVANAEILLQADFETGKDPFESYRLGPSGNDNMTVGSSPRPVCRGNYSLDVPLDAYKDKVSYRTERTGGKLKNHGTSNLRIGSEYWVAFAIYLPDDWQLDPTGGEILWQLHGSKDDGEKSRNPNMTIRIDGANWKLSRKWGAKKIMTSKSDYDGATTTILAPWETGRWTEFVLNFKLSYKDDGFLNVWMDGEKVASIKGGNTYNDDVGPYMKFGIYKNNWGNRSDWEANYANNKHPRGPLGSGFSKRLHYIDEVRIGDKNESYQSMAPNCGDTVLTAPATPPAPTGLKMTIQ